MAFTVNAAKEAIKNQTVEGEYNSYLNNKDAQALEEIRNGYKKSH